MAKKPTLAFAGGMSIAGAVSMLIGAACWGASGTDLWQALADGEMGNYMSQLPATKQLLVVNTSFWVLGVLLMATTASLMADFITSSQGLAQMGKVFSRTAASVAIGSFILMLSLAVVNPSIEVGKTVYLPGEKIE